MYGLREDVTSPSNQNRLTQLTATRLGARIFRMFVGLAWTTTKEKTLRPIKRMNVSVGPDDVVLFDAHPVKNGTEGMSDGGGFVPVVITPEMVGQTVAISLWIEDKGGSGRTSKEQKDFISMVRRFGGRAGVSRNDSDTAKIVAGEICD